MQGEIQDMQPNYYGYPQPTMSIDKVSDLEEAKKYQMFPGGTVYLLDQNEPYIYMKTSDANGRTSLRAFSLLEIELSKIQDSKYITRDDFDSFRRDILNSINALKGGQKDESAS